MATRAAVEIERGPGPSTSPESHSISPEVRRRMFLRQVRLLDLCRRSAGAKTVRIALIDGPIAAAHPSLAAANIEEHPQGIDAKSADPAHATLIASILVGSGAAVLGLAPVCTLLSLPVHDEPFQRLELEPDVAALRIARAIHRAIELKAAVIQLSLDFLPAADGSFPPVLRAIRSAVARGICTVVAAGNRPRLGASAALATEGVLPIAMADERGQLSPMSPVAICIGRGLRVPGVRLPGALPPNRIGEATGSSFAAAVACGALALLKSMRPESSPVAIAALHPGLRNRSTIPPLLDGAAWLEALNSPILR
ncbi:MAG: S8 family serine peptidase [Silvibacterium sp.]